MKPIFLEGQAGDCTSKECRPQPLPSGYSDTLPPFSSLGWGIFRNTFSPNMMPCSAEASTKMELQIRRSIRSPLLLPAFPLSWQLEGRTLFAGQLLGKGLNPIRAPFPNACQPVQGEVLPALSSAVTWLPEQYW